MLYFIFCYNFLFKIPLFILCYMVSTSTSCLVVLLNILLNFFPTCILISPSLFKFNFFEPSFYILYDYFHTTYFSQNLYLLLHSLCFYIILNLYFLKKQSIWETPHTIYWALPSTQHCLGFLTVCTSQVIILLQNSTGEPVGAQEYGSRLKD